MREWEDREPTKLCPACGLSILVEADACRWCHHDLGAPVRAALDWKTVALAAAAAVVAFALLRWYGT
jgi:hypothetical protein